MSIQHASFGERNIDFALRMALHEVDLAKLMDALTQGADPNASIEGGQLEYTPLLQASQLFQNDQTTQGLGLVQALLKAGANPNRASAYGETPLHQAASAGWPAAMDLLLAAGANPHAKNAEGMTPLHAATMLRAGRVLDARCTKSLIKAGADPEAQTHLGITPLHCACVSGHLPTIEALLAAGANARAITSTQLDATALIWRGFTHLSVQDKPIALARLADAIEDQDKNLIKAVANANLPPSQTATLDASLVMHWFKDKSHASHDFHRSNAVPLAHPGGQKSVTLDSLTFLQIQDKHPFIKGVIDEFNASHQPRPGQECWRALSQEPNLSGIAYPWVSRRSYGTGSDDFSHSQHLKFLIPIRGITATGQPCSFLLMGATEWGISKEERLLDIPDFSAAAISQMRRSFFPTLASTLAPHCARDEIFKTLLLEADLAWDLDSFFNPARFEKNELETTLTASIKPRCKPLFYL